MDKNKKVLLGFEVGTGVPIEIPIRHMAVAGQTQESGKTTTLEALVERSGVRALAFITKRGEGSFTKASRIQPYFDGSGAGRPYWEFVESIAASTMGQKLKFERAWIVRAAKGADTLEKVRGNITSLMEKSKRSMDQDIYMLLGEYLDIVLPQIAALPLSDSMKIRPGLNVMDLTGYTEEMQMLLVRSAIIWVHQHEQNVVTIIPEAWKFVPEARTTPVKSAAERLIREGAGLGNYVWIDSQDIAGVWKLILRAAHVWLIGVQREANEIKRTLSNIPAVIKKPNAHDVALIGCGRFYACWTGHAIKTYVWPVWMDRESALAIAKGEKDIKDVTQFEAVPLDRHPKSYVQIVPRKKAIEYREADVTINEAKALRSENEELKRRLAERQTIDIRPIKLTNPSWSVEEESRYQMFKERLTQELDSPIAHLNVESPEMLVKVKRKVLEYDASEGKGATAKLIADGWFDVPKTGHAVFNELVRLGYRLSKQSAYNWCEAIASEGFLTKEGDGYKAVAGLKKRIVEA